MSSSRPSSQSKRPPPGRCPTCGSSRVRAVSEDVVIRVRGVGHRFPEVPHEKCDSCGERIFGLEASKRFDALIPRRRRSRAA